MFDLAVRYFFTKCASLLNLVVYSFKLRVSHDLILEFDPSIRELDIDVSLET